MPANLGEVLRRYDRVVCPEMNLGQLALVIRAQYLVDVESHTQVRGLPFRAAELAAVIQEVIDRTGHLRPPPRTESRCEHETSACPLPARSPRRSRNRSAWRVRS